MSALCRCMNPQTHRWVTQTVKKMSHISKVRKTPFLGAIVCVFSAFFPRHIFRACGESDQNLHLSTAIVRPLRLDTCMQEPREMNDGSSFTSCKSCRRNCHCHRQWLCLISSHRNTSLNGQIPCSRGCCRSSSYILHLTIIMKETL